MHGAIASLGVEVLPRRLEEGRYHEVVEPVFSPRSVDAHTTQWKHVLKLTENAMWRMLGLSSHVLGDAAQPCAMTMTLHLLSVSRQQIVVDCWSGNVWVRDERGPVDNTTGLMSQTAMNLNKNGVPGAEKMNQEQGANDTALCSKVLVK